METSAKTPAVAASKPTAPTSQRFMRGGHQDGSDQRNVAAIIFLRVIVLSCCDGALRSTPLQSMHWTQRSKSLLHIMVVSFSIAVMRALTPVSEETRLGGLYSAHAINGWSRCRGLLHSRLPRGGQKRTGETPEA